LQLKHGIHQDFLAFRSNRPPRPSRSWPVVRQQRFLQSVCGLVTFEGSKPVKFEVQLAEVDSSGQFSCDQQLTKMCCATDFKLGQTAKTQLVSVDLANFGTTCSTTTLKT
ncbi:hypothetical protein PSHT_11056, partial [Puccinia striiformis]